MLPIFRAILTKPKWSNLVYKSALATYSRNSVAYSPAGVQVNSGVIRTWDLGLKAGEINVGGTIISDAVFVEESGTNLCPTDAGAWEQGNINPSTGVLESATARIRTINYVPVSANTQYTAKCKSGYSMRIMHYTSAGAYVTYTDWVTNGTTFTTGATTTQIKIIIRKDDVTVVTPSDVTTMQPQLEQRAYATTFIGGGATRAADSLSVNLPKPLSPYFTVVGAFAPNWADTTVNGATDRVIRTFYKDANNYYKLYWDNTNNKFVIERKVAGITDSVSSPAVTFLTSKIISLAWVNTSSGLYIAVLLNNGTIQSNKLATVKSIAGITLMYHGGDGALKANSWVLPARLLNGYQCTTDADAQRLIDGMKKTYVGGTIPVLPNNVYRLTPTASCTITWRDILSNTISTSSTYTVGTDVTPVAGAYFATLSEATATFKLK